MTRDFFVGWGAACVALLITGTSPDQAWQNLIRWAQLLGLTP